MFDFARDLTIKQRGIEGFNAGNAAARLQQRLPRLCRGIADSGDETNARNYDFCGK